MSSVIDNAITDSPDVRIKLCCQRRRRRWLDVPRYYGRVWVRWAIFAEMQQYGYTGVDAYGEVVRCQGWLFRRWSDVRRRVNLALIYSFAESLSSRSQSLPESPSGGRPAGTAGWWGDAVVYFVTLTVRHPARHTYVGQRRAIEDLRAAWRLLSAWLRRRGDCRYLRYIEAGAENGYAHIHMVVACPVSECGRAERIPEIWVRSCLKIGNEAVLEAQNIQRIDASDIHNVGAYIAKYLSKSLESANGAEDTGFWRWMEVCYRMRLRCVSMDAASRRYVRAKYASVDDIAGISGVCGEMMVRDPCDSKSLDEIEKLMQSDGGRPAARWLVYVVQHLSDGPI